MDTQVKHKNNITETSQALEQHCRFKSIQKSNIGTNFTDNKKIETFYRKQVRHWNNISEASQTVEQHFRNKSMKQHFTGIYISQKLGQPKHWDIYKINLSRSHIRRKHFRTKDKYK